MSSWNWRRPYDGSRMRPAARSAPASCGAFARDGECGVSLLDAELELAWLTWRGEAGATPSRPPPTPLRDAMLEPERLICRGDEGTTPATPPPPPPKPATVAAIVAAAGATANPREPPPVDAHADPPAASAEARTCLKNTSGLWRASVRPVPCTRFLGSGSAGGSGSASTAGCCRLSPPLVAAPETPSSDFEKLVRLSTAPGRKGAGESAVGWRIGLRGLRLLVWEPLGDERSDMSTLGLPR